MSGLKINLTISNSWKDYVVMAQARHRINFNLSLILLVRIQKSTLHTPSLILIRNYLNSLKT